MDFFEAQERAKKRTGRLVSLFVLAVLGTIFCCYAAGVGIRHYALSGGRHRVYRQELQLWDPKLFAGTCGAVLLVAGTASLFKWNQMREGGSAIAEMVGGRRIAPSTLNADERRLLNIVEEMAIASGLPVPPVYVLDEEPAINAFAAGLTHGDAVVAVTRGTLSKLNRDELQGVVAHEFSHILQGDMRLNVRITAILFGILVLGLAGRGMLEVAVRTRSLSSGKDKGGNGAVFILIGIALLIIGYVGYFFGRLIQAAVSRQREFLADAAAVQFTRNPSGIAGALSKIGGYSLASQLQNPNAGQLGHFFFAEGMHSWFGSSLATHPPLEERIRAVDPAWDGKFFDPGTLVDVQHASFVSAGLAPAPAPAFAGSRIPAPPRRPSTQATLAQAGQLTEQHIDTAQQALSSLDPELRAASQDPLRARGLLTGLLEATEAPGATTNTGTPWEAAKEQLLPKLRLTPRALRLPLAQLSTQGLRLLSRTEQLEFMEHLRKSIAADGVTSPFEFALATMVERTLSQASKPVQNVDFYSFNAVADDISIMLSSLAWTGADNEATALTAIATGTGELPLIRDRLVLLPETACTGSALSASLERLGRASLPIRKRSLQAAAATIEADGQTLEEELDLLRAVSAALDCPVPMVGARS